jgi:hypothetical protein
MPESRLRKSAVYGLEVLGSVGQGILILIMIRGSVFFKTFQNQRTVRSVFFG